VVSPKSPPDLMSPLLDLTPIHIEKKHYRQNIKQFIGKANMRKSRLQTGRLKIRFSTRKKSYGKRPEFSVDDNVRTTQAVSPISGMFLGVFMIPASTPNIFSKFY
jgi:hypothetical protein